MAGKLILTADDFGACEFIDNGIIRAVAGGHINTVSAFVTHERSEQSVRKLIELRKSLKKGDDFTFNIGLHFSVTSGVTRQNKPSSLTSDLTSPYYFRDAGYYQFDQVQLVDLHNEILAQLELLDSWLGDIPIDHVTVHHGITYLDRSFFAVFIQTIAGYSNPKYAGRHIPIRSPESWIRGRVANCNFNPDTGEKFLLPGIVMQGLGLGYWKKIKQTTNKSLTAKIEDATGFGLRTSQYLVDVIYDQACPEGLNCLINALKTNDVSAEFMFHLGFLEDEENLSEKEFRQKAPSVHGVDIGYFRKRMREELWSIEEIDLSKSISTSGINRIFYSDL
jgi:predicted glycoside hydrolase/deacetylase ChbG (UPF0249 family)